MLQNIITALTTATRTLFGNWKTTIAFVLLYAAFICSLYFFFTTPEARMWQVGLMFLLLLVIPILFFILQAIGVNYTNTQTKFTDLVGQAARDFWKLLLISLPFILLCCLFVWGVNKLETIGVTGIREAANSSEQIKTGESRIKFINTLAATINGLLMYFFLPLLLIRLWISTLRDGLKTTFRNLVRHVFRAFAPRAVVTYLLGFIVFGVLPYYLITMRTPIKSPWLDISVLALRIVVALLAILLGWVVTLGAMKILTSENEPKTAQAEQA